MDSFLIFFPTPEVAAFASSVKSNALWIDELRRWFNWPNGTLRSIADFVNFFPILLSLLWSISAMLALWMDVRQSRQRRRANRPLPSYSVLIPFYGDADAAVRTARSVASICPAPEEIVMVNDGSPEGSVPLDLALLPPSVRVVNLPRNVGKAEALNRGMATIRSEIIVCMDADTRAATDDWSGMLARFAEDPELGAVTGKIWPERVGNLTQLLQAIDYLVVICMVKCAETLWGGIMTVSGAWVAYRRSAMQNVHGWNPCTSTEDIDLSWRMQAAGWKATFDPAWTALVGMAPTWKSLWFQRRRWSSGMGRVLRDHSASVFRADPRHVPVALMALLSSVWIWVCILTAATGFLIPVGAKGRTLADLIYHWQWEYLAVSIAIFGAQILVAIVLDGQSWRRYPLLILFSPLYPLYFWLILVTSFLAGFPRGFFRCDGGRWEPTAELE